MEEKLLLGTAYHSNRILRHVEEDMVDIVNHNMNLVVHMFTHNDMDRHSEVMRDIIAASEDKGLEVWIDNWGLDCGPGDKAYFTGMYPETKAVYADGTPALLKPCYNSQEFRAFTKRWIDRVAEIGGKTIFWDEPGYHVDPTHGYACRCTRCQKLFEERFNRPMPTTIDADVAEFRTWSIVDYFADITNYAHEAGMKNVGCVMFSETRGIGIGSMDRLLSLPHFDNVGCDPYWGYRYKTAAEIYDYVYTRSKDSLALSERFQKEHNIWLQAYGAPAGTEDELVVAADAAYDAGARTILTWSFRGGESNNYRAVNTDRMWQITGEAFARLRSRWYDEMLEKIRAR